MKNTHLPFDKNFEEKEREKFWKSRNDFRPNRNLVSLDRLKESEDKEESFLYSKAVSDKNKSVKELFVWLDVEIITRNLPTKEKMAIKLKAEGYNRQEIAEQMKIKSNAVKQLVYRAYKKIKCKNQRENFPK